MNVTSDLTSQLRRGERYGELDQPPSNENYKDAALD